MKNRRGITKYLLLLIMLLMAWPAQAHSEVLIQCPGDADGDGVSDDPNIACIHIAAGDGFVKMADGYPQYVFGFSLVPPTVAPGDVTSYATLKAELPAPTITVRQGQELYLTLTNVGMMLRPDLSDPHSLHWHGFPHQAPVFDGEPMASFGTNMGASFTFYYKAVEPGTYMYHCHVEATEHMQMGMLGNLYMTPAQDGTSYEYPPGSGRAYTKFAYNDGDGSTGYDVAYPIQIHAFDPKFHDASLTVQPLDFAGIFDSYPMLNGRGYPDTIKTVPIANTYDGNESQKVHSLITATKGQRILLRISNLSFDYYTPTVLGVPMTVVGRDARILRGPTGKNLYYKTSSVDTGGGQSVDVILDTADTAPGTYFLYTTNLNNLSNNAQERGGMMTELIINP